MLDNKKILKVVELLEKNYPEAKIALEYAGPWQLLVAVILSAQCTDERVNMVTRKLFKKYPDIKDFIKLKPEQLENEIRSTGFYKNKAKSILENAKTILAQYNGKVPDKMEELLKLKGVARKTANIVLFNAYNKIEGIAVDTHVQRLSQRIGFTDEKNPVKIEQGLMKKIPHQKWGKISYLLQAHGRKICKARKPDCGNCFLNKICLKREYKK